MKRKNKNGKCNDFQIHKKYFNLAEAKVKSYSTFSHGQKSKKTPYLEVISSKNVDTFSENLKTLMQEDSCL